MARNQVGGAQSSHWSVVSLEVNETVDWLLLIGRRVKSHRGDLVHLNPSKLSALKYRRIFFDDLEEKKKKPLTVSSTIVLFDMKALSSEILK